MMKRPLALVAALLLFSACATPAPTPSPTPIPTLTPTATAPTPLPSPAISCGDLAAADCAAASTAVLTLTASKGTAIRVELGGGVFCRNPALLFADTTCPAGAGPPAGGGRWIGHALVTFAGSAAQAYVNVAKNGQAFSGALIAVATPPPETPSPS